MLFYNQYTRHEDLDEIGDIVLKEYFPSGRLDDNTHLNAVKVIDSIILLYYNACIITFILIYNII